MSEATEQKVHVIYHRADFDGLLSAAVCLYFMPEAILHGWDHGDPQIEIPNTEPVYIVDLPPDCIRLHLQTNLVWIDHHKSSIEKFDGTLKESEKAYGVRLDGVAACRLCWHYFSDPQHEEMAGACGLSAEYFQKRLVKEPMVLTLAGEYDVWDLHDRQAIWLQHGLAAYSHDPYRLVEFLDQRQDRDINGELCPPNGDERTRALMSKGAIIEDFSRAQAADVLKDRSYTREWEGLKFLVLNTAKGNSRSYPGTEERDDVDALMMWRYDGQKVTVSLYHKQGREDLDLSLIAVKYGGGGHRGACGFQATLAFMDQMGAFPPSSSPQPSSDEGLVTTQSGSETTSPTTEGEVSEIAPNAGKEENQ